MSDAHDHASSTDTSEQSISEQSEITDKLPTLKKSSRQRRTRSQHAHAHKKKSSTIPLQEELDEKPPSAPQVTLPLPEYQAPAKVTHPLPEKMGPSQVASDIKNHSVKRSRLLLTLALLLFVALSSFFLLRDLTASYLYTYTFHANNGTLLHQTNLGMQDEQTTFTTTVSQGAQTFLGLQHSQPAQDQILRIDNSTLSASRQLSGPLLNLGIDANNELVVAGPRTLQVRQPTGTLRWQVPTMFTTSAAHRFTPLSDTSTLYSIQATSPGRVAAYALTDGTERWSSPLPDSLAYTPPFVLGGETLYVAADHTLFALNSQNGRLRWQIPLAARTLQLEKTDQTYALLAASAQGLLALSPYTGDTLWSFNGFNNSSYTAQQFYQASFLQDQTQQDTSHQDIVYAIGIRWQIPQIRQESWLSAVAVPGGKLLWSQQLGVGPVSGDTARVFTPLLSRDQRTVILHHQERAAELHITAYDAINGKIRWDASLHTSKTVAPNLIQTQNGNIQLFTINSNGLTGVATLPPSRYFMFIAALLSVLGLFLLWLPVFRRRGSASRPKTISDESLTPLPGKRGRFVRPLLLIIVLIFLLGSTLLAYRSLNQPRSNVLLREQQQQRLQVSKPNGSSWQTFSSEGHFTLSTVSTHPGTQLVTLQAPTHIPYQAAPADPAYTSQVASLFLLYLFSQSDGQVLWQSTIVQPQELQQANILGTDATFIYVSTLPTDPAADAAQLLAIDQRTGTIAWRIFGPPWKKLTSHDKGSLLIHAKQLTWQINSTAYFIDSTTGQLEQQRPLSQAPSSEASQGR